MLNKCKLVALILALIVSGCSGGGGGGGTGGAINPQSSVTLTNVNQMLVAPDGLVSSAALTIDNFYNLFQAAFGINNAYAAGAVNQVYAIDPSGVITAAKLADLVAGKSSSATSDLVIDTPKFLIFRYNGLYQPVNNAASSQQCVLLGVRKSDGRFACINSNPRCDTINSCQVNSYLSQIKVDPTGNIFFIVLGDGGLEKVDLTDPSKPIYTSIFTHLTVGDATVPVVSSNADVMTSINLMSSSTNIESRIYSGSSLKYTISESQVRCSFTGPSADSGNFYYIAYLQGAAVSLFKLTRDANGSYQKSTINASADGSNGLSMSGTNCARVAAVGDKVFTIGYKPSTGLGNILYEPLNSSLTPTFHNLSPDFSYATDLLAYDNGLVIVGANSNDSSHGIQRYNPSTNSFVSVLNIGDYKIDATAVSPNGQIVFTGTKLTDSKSVIVTISDANILSIKEVVVKPTSIASVK